MSYRVFWSPYAEKRLETILSNAQDVSLLVLATEEIDRYLAAIPKELGESRYDTIRIGFVPPLGVQFELLDDVQTASVYDVWRIDRRS
jgi:hypothetical protein